MHSKQPKSLRGTTYAIMSTESSSDTLLQLAFTDRNLNYISVVNFSLLLYDIVIGISEEIHILTPGSVNSTNFIYVISRSLIIGQAGIVCAFGVWSVKSCHQVPLLLASKCLTAVLTPCNTWLFFLRVRAIPDYPHSRAIVYICMILWISTFTSFLVFLAFRISSSPNGDGTCSVVREYHAQFLCAPFATLVAFDTAVMIAVLLGFIAHSPASTWTGKVKSVFLIEHVGEISGAFIRSGLIYYLTTIGIHLSVIIIASSSVVPSLYMTLVGVLVITFHSIMTSRVFRLLKLSQFNGPGNSTITGTSTIVFHNVSDDQSHTSQIRDIH